MPRQSSYTCIWGCTAKFHCFDFDKKQADYSFTFIFLSSIPPLFSSLSHLHIKLVALIIIRTNICLTGFSFYWDIRIKNKKLFHFSIITLQSSKVTKKTPKTKTQTNKQTNFYGCMDLSDRLVKNFFVLFCFVLFGFCFVFVCGGVGWGCVCVCVCVCFSGGQNYHNKLWENWWFLEKKFSKISNLFSKKKLESVLAKNKNKNKNKTKQKKKRKRLILPQKKKQNKTKQNPKSKIWVGWAHKTG